MQSLGGNDFLRMLEMGTRHLERNQEHVNALNVFPVPDGDTGTNMTLTLRAALKQATESASDNIGEVAEAAARGALFGARGNSGVILSQFVRGLADGLAGKAEAGPEDLVIALESASDRAYAAVMEPSEGTMLTVGRRTAEAARKALDPAGDIQLLLQVTLKATQRAVEETPTMLAVLREAGVVDAGGEGMAIALEGAVRALTESLPGDGGMDAATDAPGHGMPEACSSHEGPDGQVIDHGGAIDIADIRFRYCTEFLIHAHDKNIDSLRSDLAPLGDSLIVVGDSSLIKVHLHTNHPGKALEICGELGDLEDIKIDNMVLQNKAAATKQRGQVSSGRPIDFNGSLSEPAWEDWAPPPKLSVVAVTQGDGFAAIFSDLGVESHVNGGQTMNPSTEEIQQAIDNLAAPTVVVLPNNGNIVMAARQAASLSQKQVHVLPTKSMPQGVAAMIAFDPSRPVDQAMTDMERAANLVRTGEVTRAVRSVQSGSHDIREGHIIGLVSGEIVASGERLDDVLSQLVEALCDDKTELITLYYGSDVDKQAAEVTSRRLAQQRDHIDVECYPGGQPFYDYLIAVE